MNFTALDIKPSGISKNKEINKKIIFWDKIGKKKKITFWGHCIFFNKGVQKMTIINIPGKKTWP